MDLETIARALGGEISGRYVRAPGPGHSPQDDSLSVWIDPSAPDGFHVGSFASDDKRTCLDHVRERLGRASGEASPHYEARNPPPAPASTKVQTADALWHWREASDPRETRVEKYLQYRGLTLPEEAAGRAIRYASC